MRARIRSHSEAYAPKFPADWVRNHLGATGVQNPGVLSCLFKVGWNRIAERILCGALDVADIDRPEPPPASG